MAFQSHGQQDPPSLASVLYFLQKEHANFDRERGRYVCHESGYAHKHIYRQT